MGVAPNQNTKAVLKITFKESLHHVIEKGFSILIGKSLTILGNPPLNDGAIKSENQITGIIPNKYIHLGNSLSFIYISMPI